MRLREESAFDLRPNYIFYCEPMSPLHSGKDALEKLMYCAEHNIPLVYTPCPIAGGTAPATLAGVLVTALAESLHGLVIGQLIRPGHGFIAGGVVSIMDMADTTLAYGAPELSLLSAALADVLEVPGHPDVVHGRLHGLEGGGPAGGHRERDLVHDGGLERREPGP